jgi:hypothetical protein
VRAHLVYIAETPNLSIERTGESRTRLLLSSTHVQPEPI